MTSAGRCWAVMVIAITAIFLPPLADNQRVIVLVRQELTFLGVDNCSKVSPNYLTNVAVIRTEDGRSYIKADLIINKSSEGKLKWQAETYKCDNRHNTDCEYFLKFHMNDFCANLNQKDQIWTPFFNSSQPKLACPINKKMYRLSKIMLDTEKILVLTKPILSVTDFYWKVKTKISQCAMKLRASEVAETSSIPAASQQLRRKKMTGSARSWAVRFIALVAITSSPLVDNQRVTYLRLIRGYVEEKAYKVMLSKRRHVVNWDIYPAKPLFHCLLHLLVAGKTFPAQEFFQFFEKVKQAISFLGIDNCTTPSPNYMTNVSVMRTESGRSYMKADLIINKINERKLKLNAEAYKCEDRDANICEYFMKIAMKDFCTNLSQKDEIWTPFFNSSQPEFLCPINKKLYRFSKIMLNNEKVWPMAKMLPSVTDFYWRVKLKITQVNPTTMWMCYHIKLKIDTIKARQV
ncbi:hypothetical protein AAG570_011393 [Ranatra chinensis]|uniref:Uncharacterized protein n=1 Tax=Ranatra chinensis TaxID=642074 RepID=A0ABD0YKH8_9HEMI